MTAVTEWSRRRRTPAASTPNASGSLELHTNELDVPWHWFGAVRHRASTTEAPGAVNEDVQTTTRSFGRVLYVRIAEVDTSALTADFNSDIADEYAERQRTREGLRKLASADPSERKRLRVLLRSVAPQTIAEAAFEEYDHTYETAVLRHARSLLEDRGAEAWVGLKWIVTNRMSDCELFVGAIVRCASVSPAEKTKVVMSMARSSSSSVRATLFEHLADCSSSDRSLVLAELKKDTDADIRAEAIAWLDQPV